MTKQERKWIKFETIKAALTGILSQRESFSKDTDISFVCYTAAKYGEQIAEIIEQEENGG